MNTKYCSRCDQETKTEVIILTSGPHYAKEVCSVCGRYHKWVKKPKTQWDARAGQPAEER